MMNIPDGPGASENDRLKLRKLFQQLSETTRLKDKTMGRHITRIRYYAQILTAILAHNKKYQDLLTPDLLKEIGFLAALHDVGEIGTPDDILNKHGKLSLKERKIMQEHTINGAFILSSYPDPRAREIALYHHERWDGSGYPYGLVEDMIPLCARIVALTDVYDALRTKRNYKEAFSHQKATKIIVSNAGVLFDPEITEYFLTVDNRFAEIFKEFRD